MTDKNSGATTRATTHDVPRPAYGRDRPASEQVNRITSGVGRHVDPWTKDEDAVLQRLYPVGGWRLVNKDLPHRTQMGIRARAKRFALEVIRPEKPAPGEPKPRAKQEPWTAEQVATLKRMSGSHTTAQIGQAIGKTRRQVDKKKSQLGLTFHGSKAEQKERIRKVRRDWPAAPKADRIKPPAPRYPSVWHYAQGAQA
jgi:hypothetical protein